MMLKRYERNIALVTDSKQCQPCWRNDLASRTPAASAEKPVTHTEGTPGAYKVSRACATVIVEMVRVKIVSEVKS